MIVGQAHIAYVLGYSYPSGKGKQEPCYFGSILMHFVMSLQASLCVRGKELLYKYCFDRGIPHKQIGKLIVATTVAEVPKLEGLLRRGTENRVEDLQIMEGSQAMQMEPELQCVKALLSPSSGIVDSHSFMLSLVVLSTSD